MDREIFGQDAMEVAHDAHGSQPVVGSLPASPAAERDIGTVSPIAFLVLIVIVWTIHGLHSLLQYACKKYGLFVTKQILPE
tara:strand:- start:265 stop:507 length:243 start_codon:yes stop_codon:yes gene_type:complete